MVFDAPDADGSTTVAAINQEGTITGYLQDPAGVSHGSRVPSTANPQRLMFPSRHPGWARAPLPLRSTCWGAIAGMFLDGE